MLDQATASDIADDAGSADAETGNGSGGDSGGDHVAVLARMLADVDALWQQIERDRERLEAALPEDDPGRQRTTYIAIGRARCGSPDEVRAQAARLGIDAAPMLAIWSERERQRVAARRRARLDRLDLADRMARSGYTEIRNQIACTPAISTQGVAAKIELVVAGLRDGAVGDERAIAESALRDIVALGG